MAQSRASEETGVRALRVAFLVLCTVGACLSADLVRLHVKVHTDPDYHSYCAISERVNCDTVALSPHSVFAGLPLSVWGLLGYFLLAALAVWGLRRRLPSPSWPFGLLFLLALFCVAVSAALLAVSVVAVRAGCIVCGGTYLVNAALAIVAGIEARRSGGGIGRALLDEIRDLRARHRAVLAFAAVFAAAVAVLWLSVPRYWRLDGSTGPGGLPVGTTADGHAWIGARKPVLEITEFSDHQCPFCQRGHEAMRELLARFPEKVRLVHRHYPLDNHCNATLGRPFHPHACAYAFLAECAGEQGRFWEASDYLFANGRRSSPVTAEELAEAAGLDGARLRSCLASDRPRKVVEADIAAGWSLGVRGTPTFVVGGRVYPGSVPAEVLEEALGPPARTP